MRSYREGFWLKSKVGGNHPHPWAEEQPFTGFVVGLAAVNLMGVVGKERQSRGWEMAPGLRAEPGPGLRGAAWAGPRGQGMGVQTGEHQNLNPLEKETSCTQLANPRRLELC